MSGSVEAQTGVLYSSAYRAFLYIIVTRKHTYTLVFQLILLYVRRVMTHGFNLCREKTERITCPKMRKNLIWLHKYSGASDQDV